METAPTFVLVNPRSQGGTLGKRWPGLAQILRQEIGPFEEHLTQAPGDATRICRAAVLAGASRIIAVGGDGTLHEVAGGFFDPHGHPLPTQAALGLLPCGTGGDFRRTAGIPQDFAHAARALATARPRSIDVGRLTATARASGSGGTPSQTTCIFINIASFGLSGDVVQLVNRSSKMLGGRLSFLLGTLRAGISYRNQRVRLIYDGQDDDFQELRVQNVVVANGRYFGGGMHVAPQARIDDGLFDVVTLGDMNPVDIVTKGPLIYSGAHLHLDKVSVRRARRLDARAVEPGAQVGLDADGESPGVLPATFEILPAAIPFLFPE